MIKIENRYLNFIVNSLSALKLDEKESSARRRFIRDLSPIRIANEVDQKELRGRLCEKDEKGNLKVVDNEYCFKNVIIRKSFEEEWEKLNVATFELQTDGREKDIETIKKIINDEINKYKTAHKNFSDSEYDYVSSLQEFVDLLKI